VNVVPVMLTPTTLLVDAILMPIAFVVATEQSVSIRLSTSVAPPAVTLMAYVVCPVNATRANSVPLLVLERTAAVAPP